MHMLSLKRFCLLIPLMLMLFFIGVGSSVYFLDVNDYSQWIAKQIKQSTGYDVRFETFENNWLSNRAFSISGLSLYQQQQRILYIQRLSLEVDRLDLWQRELEIGRVVLSGVEVDVQQPLNLSEKSIEASDTTERQVTDLQNIAWERLYVKQFKMTDINASIKHKNQKLQLAEANVALNNLSLIEKKQLQTLPKNLYFLSDFKHLAITEDQQTAEIENFQLTMNANLQNRQGQLTVSSDRIHLQSPLSEPIVLEAVNLELKLDNNKLILEEFMLDLFSGSLALTAQAQLGIKLLPKPAVTVQQVVVSSFLAKDMQLNIPAFKQTKAESKPTVDKQPLAVASLLIEKLKVENITLLSESELFPFQLKSADAQLNQLYVIKDNKLLDLATLNEQSASFSLAFDSFSWQESVVEQFAVAGSLQQQDPAWQLLKSIVIEK